MAIVPHWKNEMPSACPTERRQPRRSKNAVLRAKSSTPSVTREIRCSITIAFQVRQYRCVAFIDEMIGLIAVMA